MKLIFSSIKRLTASPNKHKVRAVLYVISVNILLLFPCSVSSVEEVKHYYFGVVPQFDSRKIHNIWRPILDELERSTGLKFSLKGSPTIPDFEQEFIEGAFDFVYMNPYHILAANKSQKYSPIVKDVGRLLYGIVVVAKDSPIQNVQELNGKVLAFPAPNALGASLMPRADFINKYNIKIKPKYVKTHSSVYLNVALGEVAAGGGVQKTLDKQSSDIRNALRIIYQTERVSPHPIAVHPRVVDKVRLLVSNALLAMGQTERGRNLLAQIPMKKIGPANMKDYEPIAELGLDKLYQESH